MPGPSLLFVGNFLDVHVGTRAVSEDLSLRLEQRGWPVLRTSNKRRKLDRLFDMLRTAWDARRQYDIAILDVYSGPAFRFAELVGALLRRLGKPYVLILHGGNLPAFSRRQSRRIKRLFRGAARVTTPSRYLQDSMQIYHQDLRLLPNSVDLSAYRYRLRSKPRPKLLWLRAFHETYNPLLALSAIDLLREEFPEIHLTMVGPDKGLQNTVREEVLKRGLQKYIEVRGGVPKSEVPAQFEDADIFLNTTNVDNTPVSVLEAMASGLCVVSTNVGGIPYLLTDHENALLAEPRNPVGLAVAIRTLLRAPDLARELSVRGRGLVEAFDWNIVIPQWQQLLSGVCAASASFQDSARCEVMK
jgi:glycosyltransferase involved in cell wall biosynthesis